MSCVDYVKTKCDYNVREVFKKVVMSLISFAFLK